MKIIHSLDELLDAPTHPIGHVISADYTHATFVSDDALLREAGGLAMRTFLLAVSTHDLETKDVHEVLLLSVAGSAPLESDRQLSSIREDMARRGNSTEDPRTKAELQWIGFRAEIVGTFFNTPEGVRFGGDVDRIRANSAFKVFKPAGEPLARIASFSRNAVANKSDGHDILKIGRVRYTETESVADLAAEVHINVKDFIGKKSALLGTTRSGKSNSIKIIAKKIFDHSHRPGRAASEPMVGQIIFDPQGEYANPNSQDQNYALAEIGQPGDVRIYKMLRSDEAETEKLRHLQFNLFEEENINFFWQLMLQELNSSVSGGSNYVASLESIHFFKPNPKFSSPEELEQARRKMLGFYALVGNSLNEVHALEKPFNITVGSGNVDAITERFEELKVVDTEDEATGTFEIHTTEAAQNLMAWILDNEAQVPKDLKKELTKGVLTVFKEQISAQAEGKNGVSAAFRRAMRLHNTDAQGDVRDKIWRDLSQGRLVIVDLSKGSSRTTTNLSELIVQHLVSEASDNFTAGREPVPFQIIVEEAHNLFRREGQGSDTNDPWVRLSKEASKYRIGLVYATQEVTGVDPQILSNTSNWIVAHLNSRKELKELAKYYNFEIWSEHLIRVETKGFVRLKTESSPFIIPVQIDLFRPEDGDEGNGKGPMRVHNVVMEIPEDDGPATEAVDINALL